MNDLSLLTESEVASMLQVSRRILRSLRSSGELGYCRVGRQIRYLAEHVTAFIDQASRVEIVVRTNHKQKVMAPANLGRIRTFTERKAAC